MSQPIVLPLAGNNAAFDAEYLRSADIATSAADTISKSYKAAGAAAQMAAKQMGASVDMQVASAAKAAVAWTDASAKMSAAQRNAGNAAMQAARRAGEGLDIQSAAYTRAIQATQAYEAATAKAAAASAANAEKVAAFSKSLASLGKWTAGGLAVTAVFSVKGASELQAQMEKLKTQAGATQQQVGLLTKGVLNMAGSVGTGPNDLAQGMYHVVSSLNATLPAASRASDELKVLQIAAEGAKVGGASLVDVTNALDAAIISGIKGAQNYTQAMGLLNSTVGAGDMTMQDLADAFSKGIAVNASVAGVSLKQLGGALAVLGDNNIRGAAAGTLLTSTLRVMKAPSEAAAKALGSIGISSMELAGDLHSGGLVGALSDLQDKLTKSGATAEQTGLVLERAFGGRQSTGLQILLTKLDLLRTKTDLVGAGAGNFAADWAATQKTFAFQMQQIEASVEALSDKFGAVLIPKLQAVATATENVVDWFEKNKGAGEAVAAMITGVLGAAVTTFAVSKAVAFVDGVRAMSGAVLALGADATAAGAELSAMGDEAVAATGAAGLASRLGLAGGVAAAGYVLGGGKNGWSTKQSGATGTGLASTVIGSGTHDSNNVGDALRELDPFGSHFNKITKVSDESQFTVNNLTALQKGLSGVTSATSLSNLQLKSFYTITNAILQQGDITGKQRAGLKILASEIDPSSVAKTRAQQEAVAKAQSAANTASAKAKEAASGKGLSSSALRDLGVGGAIPSTSPASSTTAAATSAIPAAVATMLATAKSLEGTRYTWGGGHGGWDPVAELKKIGVDCSGFVSQVLHAGGVQLPGPQTTTGLAQDLKPGVGKDVTVWDRANAGSQSHTIMDILGKWFESGGSSEFNPAGGVSNITPAEAAGEMAGKGFQPFHPLYSATLAKDKSLGGLGVSANPSSTQTENLSQLIANALKSIAAPANSMIARYGSATQSGSVNSLDSVLGGRPKRGSSFSDLMVNEAGTAQGKAFQAEEIALQQTGQDKLADRLGIAHTEAMEKLSNKLIALQQAADAKLVADANEAKAHRISADAELLNKQASALKDQTTAMQDSAANQLTVMKAQQQKISDMAAAVVQKMANMQQTVDDQMAGVAQAIRDQATVKSDSGQSTIDAINDNFQTQIDTIGEKGLYGLALIAQQDQVAADQVKAYWDQQIDLMQLQLDTDQQSADAAESAAKINVDQVTTQQQMLVAQAQTKLDNVTMTQDQRIASAQAHADAITAHVDASMIGPAQIAVDMNANAPKSVQDIFAAQLTKATGAGDKIEGAANKNATDITDSANKLIQAQQDNYNNVSDTANKYIQTANDTLSSITDKWNNTLATDQSNISGTNTSSGIAEGTASGTTGVANANSSTQFAGGGTTVNIYGVPTTDASAIGDAVSWAVRTSGLQTV